MTFIDTDVVKYFRLQQFLFKLDLHADDFELTMLILVFLKGIISAGFASTHWSMPSPSNYSILNIQEALCLLCYVNQLSFETSCPIVATGVPNGLV